MTMEPDKPEWHNAIKQAPDEYEIQTTYRRYATEADGKTVYREKVVSRKIVANGRLLYEEHANRWIPSVVT